GCCPLAALHGDTFAPNISPETHNRSTLGELKATTDVNIELPIAAGDALQGHLVQGHVDAVGKVTLITDENRVWIRPPKRVLDELIPKSSIAVDGVSLTIAEIGRDRFAVALIPSTLE